MMYDKAISVSVCLVMRQLEMPFGLRLQTVLQTCALVTDYAACGLCFPLPLQIMRYLLEVYIYVEKLQMEDELDRLCFWIVALRRADGNQNLCRILLL